MIVYLAHRLKRSYLASGICDSDLLPFTTLSMGTQLLGTRKAGEFVERGGYLSLDNLCDDAGSEGGCSFIHNINTNTFNYNLWFASRSWSASGSSRSHTVCDSSVWFQAGCRARWEN